uniref:Uncharacterized protein n=1 Tax=Siphoviridae sp. ctnR15 TaxID=2827938 RepID=A0A8S5T2B5_9CAUD|nr:MAG TPA: hypothetical protein [Siphoviridae sp. ctnR15]
MHFGQNQPSFARWESLFRDGCVTVVAGRVLYRGGRLVMPLVSKL